MTHGAEVIWQIQRRLTYFPLDDVPPVSSIFEGAEDITFETRDGLGLRGWFVPVSFTTTIRPVRHHDY